MHVEDRYLKQIPHCTVHCWTKYFCTIFGYMSKHSPHSPLNPKELREWRTRNLNCNSRNHRKIRLTEGNEKCRHLKKLTGKGTLRQSLMPKTPYPFHLHTVYVYTSTVYLFTQRRGRIEPERRSEGQQFTKMGRNTSTRCIQNQSEKCE